jgi:hypothetical protein
MDEEFLNTYMQLYGCGYSSLEELEKDIFSLGLNVIIIDNNNLNGKANKNCSFLFFFSSQYRGK